MTEHQRGKPLGPFQDPDGGPWRTEGEQAVEAALFDEEAVDIAVYVKGRMIHTKTDAATLARIMAILTGMGA